jgi:hypothetical protein
MPEADWTMVSVYSFRIAGAVDRPSSLSRYTKPRERQRQVIPVGPAVRPTTSKSDHSCRERSPCARHLRWRPPANASARDRHRQSPTRTLHRLRSSRPNPRSHRRRTSARNDRPAHASPEVPTSVHAPRPTSTSSAYAATRLPSVGRSSRRRRSAGPEMLRAAIGRRPGPEIGAATQITSSSCSPRSSA